jgi:serralysin
MRFGHDATAKCTNPGAIVGASNHLLNDDDSTCTSGGFGLVTKRGNGRSAKTLIPTSGYAGRIVTAVKRTEFFPASVLGSCPTPRTDRRPAAVAATLTTWEMMMKTFLRKLFAPATPTARRTTLGLEGLDERTMLSVTTGTIADGITWRFEYNEQAKVGTFTVNGTDADERIYLTERSINADADEPYGNETRPIGIDVVLGSGNEHGGTPNFAPGSTITVVVNAGRGNDTVVNATRFASVLDGGAGNDILTVVATNTAANQLFGGAGNDSLTGGSGNDLLVGGLGNDMMGGGDGDDALWGDDRVLLNGVYVSSGSGTDILLGNMGHDLLRGGGGDDQLWGDHAKKQMVNGRLQWVSLDHGGNDQLFGEAGNDYLIGGWGNDTLEGGAGNDWLFGGKGNDTLRGGDDRDYLFGGDGSDSLNGGTASDYLRVGGFNDPFWGVDQFYIPHGVTGNDNDTEVVIHG